VSMRVCENAVRAATIVAVGRHSPTVDRRDIEWGLALAQHSFQATSGGIDKYMREYLEFPKFCEAVLAKIAQCGGWCSIVELERAFRSNKRSGWELDNVFKQLMKEERIEGKRGRKGDRGPMADGYALVAEKGA
jgi:hypothetical protein